MKKLLLILLCLPLLFISCQEDDPTPSSAAPSSSSPCGIVSVDDGSPLSYSPLTPCTGPGQPSYTVVNGELKGINAAFISFNGSAPEWMCAGEIVVFSSESINLNQVYSVNSLPIGWVMNLSFAHILTEGSYFNYDLSNPTIKNGSMTITYIDYSTGIVDGNFSFTGYQVSGNNVKQFSCNFSNVPFTLL